MIKGVAERKIALFDIDDTIYRGGIIFPLMKSEVEDGLLQAETLDTVHACKDAYKRGELAYEEQSRQVVIAWAEGLQGMERATVAQHAEKFIRDDLKNFYLYTPKLLDALKETHDAFVITNEPQFVAEPVCKIFGFTSYVSTIFEVEGSTFTGAVSRFNSSQSDKGVSVAEAISSHSLVGSFAFGDSISDLKMFEAVEKPVCINANTELHAVAQSRGYELATPDSVLDIVSKALKNS